MGKTMEDGGLLVKGDDGSLKVSIPTTIKFLDLRKSKIIEKNLSSTIFEIGDRERFPEFFKKWIDGILFDKLMMLNLEGNISLPIFDPTAMSSKLGLEAPSLSLSEILLGITSPPGSFVPLMLMGVEIPDFPKILAKIPGVISIPIPPIPKPPLPPSLNFPTMGMPGIGSPEFAFSIYGKHYFMNLQLPKMFSGLFEKIASPKFLGSFSFDGLFDLAKEVVISAFPPPPAPNLSDYTLNMECVAEIIADGIAITVLGNVIGSSGSGAVGFAGAQRKHRKPPPPKSQKPSWVPYVPQERPVNLNYMVNEKTDGPTRGESSFWTGRLKKCREVIQKRNQSRGDRAWEENEIHAQLLLGAINAESGAGTTTPQGSNNWGGIQCNRVNGKWTTGLGTKTCTGQGQESLGGGVSQAVSYVIFADPADSMRNIVSQWYSKGFAKNFNKKETLTRSLGKGSAETTMMRPSISEDDLSHKLKQKKVKNPVPSLDIYKPMNGKIRGPYVSVADYFINNGPAESEEPGPDDDRATFFRIYFALHREPLYYQGKIEAKSKLAHLGPKGYASFHERNPDFDENTLAICEEVVQTYTYNSVAAIGRALFYSKEKWALPIGTFKDALMWWHANLGETSKYVTYRPLAKPRR